MSMERKEALTEMGIKDGFISYSVNIRLEDGLALGLPGVTMYAAAAAWAQVLRQSFPGATVAIVRYVRTEVDRNQADKLTAAIKQWLIDARGIGRRADLETLRDLGYWLTWELDTSWPACERRCVHLDERGSFIPVR